MTTSTNYPYDQATVINGAVGSDPYFCMGYLNPGASGTGYISTLKLSVGSVSVENLDEVTEGIVAYDRCEKNDAYIGQINMLTASSFCGLNGAIWGYDLATAENLRGDKLDLPYDIPVYNVAPLLDATQRLFGIEAPKYRRFNPMPGAHVVCANKSKTATGPIWVWSAIALAILDDRSTGACLFIEDANIFPSYLDEKDVGKYLYGTLGNIVNSVLLCGKDQGVTYKEIFTGYKYLYVDANTVGSALTCAPYITFAHNAIPDYGAGGKASDIMQMTIGEWEAKLKLPPLPPAE